MKTSSLFILPYNIASPVANEVVGKGILFFFFFAEKPCGKVVV